MRDLDRERMKMEQQEKKVIADIKKLAKDNQMDAVKIMAKDLVRTRRQVRKFMLMKANIQAVSLKIQTLKSQNTMAQAMKGVSKAMMNMNKNMNLPQIQQILHEFEKQSEIMDMKEEMINDVMDDAMEEEGDDEETDAVVSQVLDELGLQLTDTLSGLPQVCSQSLSLHMFLYNVLYFRHQDPCPFRVLNSHKQLQLPPEEEVVVPQMLMMNYRSALITYVVSNFFS
jgi:charged multivesicular body protein 2A